MVPCTAFSQECGGLGNKIIVIICISLSTQAVDRLGIAIQGTLGF